MISLPPIDRHRAYSTKEAAAYLGCDAKKVRTLAQTGQFGPDGAWEQLTSGGRVHGIRIAGWAIEQHIKSHAFPAAS